MDRVTLAGLPGLLRRGAPVRWRLDEQEEWSDNGTIVAYGDHNEVGAVAWEDGGECFVEDGIPGEWLKLDLDDPAGRDIAARWLAERLGLTVGATAPEWWRTRSHSEGEPIHYWVLTVRTGWNAQSYVYFHSEGEDDDGANKWVLVPGISTLTNPAQALRAACLAVGGGS